MADTVPGVRRAVAQLDDTQRRAVEASPDRPLVGRSGAGGGKTRVLVARIGYLIHERAFDPATVLAITFKSETREEMRGRVTDMLGDAGRLVYVETYHSWGLKLLRWEEFAAYTSVSARCRLCKDDIALDAAALAAARAADVRAVERMREPAKVVRAAIGQYKAGHPERAHHALRTTDVDQVIALVRAYDKTLHDKDRIDFADMVKLPTEALARHEGARALVWDKIRHVLADEFQDTNRPQMAMLAWMAGPPGRLSVFGDECQKINVYQGAVPRIISNFVKVYPHAEVVDMVNAYRLTEPVAAVANQVALILPGHTGPSVGMRGDGPKPTVHVAQTQLEEWQWIVDYLLDKRREGHVARARGHTGGIHRWRDVLVMGRTRRQNAALIRAMAGRIPTRTGGSEELAVLRGVPTLLAWLDLLADPSDARALRRAVDAPTFRLGRALDRVAGEWDVARLYGDETIGDRFDTRERRNLARFLQAYESFQGVVGPTIGLETFDLIVRSTGLDGQDGLPRPVLDRLRRQVQSDKDVEGLRLEASEARVFGDEDAVSVYTVHQAKGLEFAWVFMHGVNDGLFPHRLSTEQEDLDAEACMFYVGITRTTRHLIISASHEPLSDDAPQGQPSPYLSLITPDLLEVV